LSALYQLAAPNTPTKARQQVAERIEAGETLSCTTVAEVIAEAKNGGAAEDGRSPPGRGRSRSTSQPIPRATGAALILGNEAGNAGRPVSAGRPVKSNRHHQGDLRWHLSISYRNRSQCRFHPSPGIISLATGNLASSAPSWRP